MDHRIIRTDVAILGSGGAGLRAAIAAGRSGASVALIGKGKINRSGATLLAGANVSADIGCDGGNLARLGIDRSQPDDTPAAWFEDVVAEGFFLNEQTMVERYVELAGLCLEEMIGWGMPVLGMEGSRAVSVPSTGILDCLYSQIKTLEVQQFPDMMGLEVLTQDGRAVGVLAWDLVRGEVLFFEAKAVILATGGAHGLYDLNTGSSDLTGDGQAIASRAGAEMVDMEMVSFLPTTVLYPVMFRGNILPYILCTLGYGELVNGLGEPFVRVHYAGKMAEAALHSEWNKLLLSRAILAEMRTQPGEHGGAYFSMKKVAASEFSALRGRFPGLAQDPYKRMLDDLEDGKDLEIAPAGHYFEGGIRVNSRCETSIPGLYAAGECSGGLFGANRVAAATTEMVVQGRIAGEEAAKLAKVRGQATGDSGRLINACLRETFAAHATPPGDVLAARDRLRQLSALHLGLTRSVAGLEVLQGELRELRDLMGAGPMLAYGSRYDLVSLVRLTLRNMIDCADLMCRASRAREESRGVFFRSDFPTTDNDRFLQHVVQARAANDVRTNMEDIAVTSVKLPGGRFSYEEYLAKVVEQA